MKKCSTCEIQKLFSDFCKNKSRKDGYHNQCNLCLKEYRDANKEQYQQYCKTNKEKIIEQKKQYMSEYWKVNKEQHLQYNNQYQKANLARMAAKSAKRRAIKLQATPIWLTEEDIKEIEEFYKQSQLLKSITGEEHHVDHIIPLQGKNVCGLHVPWNLQVITAKENLSKYNKILQE